ncbi:DUF4326 domain-containing protein [Streptomyces californicus]|uniref:DUF4326 domain-containing protein n=1 Tax=Streptomyces californicus TaxID=67351 RepID=UPI003811681D
MARRSGTRGPSCRRPAAPDGQCSGQDTPTSTAPLGLASFVPADDQRDAHTLAVELYEMWVHAHPQLLERARRDLAGRDLMCWCADTLPCHIDPLLAIANQPHQETSA